MSSDQEWKGMMEQVNKKKLIYMKEEYWAEQVHSVSSTGPCPGPMANINSRDEETAGAGPTAPKAAHHMASRSLPASFCLLPF